MLYAQRERFEKYSVKIGLIFSKLGLTPNQWTILSLMPAIISFYYLINNQYLLSGTFLLLAGFLDVVDGAVARVTRKVSKLGAYLGTIDDRYVEGLILIGLFLVTLNTPQLIFFPMSIWLLLYLFGSFLTTYAKAAAKEKDIVSKKELKGGILERAERLSLLTIGIFLAHWQPTYLNYVIILLAIFTNISALQRIILTCKTAK